MLQVLRGLCVLLESHDDVCVFHDERRLLQVLRGLSVLLESLLVKSFIGVDCSTEVRPLRTFEIVLILDISSHGIAADFA